MLWLHLSSSFSCIYNSAVCACVHMFWLRCQVTCFSSLSRSFSNMAVMSSPAALSWARRCFSSSKSAITYRHTHIQSSGEERWIIMTAPSNKQNAYIVFISVNVWVTLLSHISSKPVWLLFCGTHKKKIFWEHFFLYIYFENSFFENFFFFW